MNDLSTLAVPNINFRHGVSISGDEFIKENKGLHLPLDNAKALSK